MGEKKSKLVEIKTKASEESVENFISRLTDEQQQADCFLLVNLMKKITKEEATLWGGSLIGFGTKRYKSQKTGREVDWFKIGFSPRKANLSLHLVTNLQKLSDELQSLGKYKLGTGCIYINRLKDIDLPVLEKIIEISFHEK